MEKISCKRRYFFFVISMIFCVSLLICGGCLFFNQNKEMQNEDLSLEANLIVVDGQNVSSFDAVDNQYIISWDAGDGVFYVGTDTETDFFQTLTTLNEKYVFPDVEPTRVGYDFLGWFDAQNLSSQLYENSYFYNTSKISFVAKWELKENLELTIIADSNVSEYSVSNNQETYHYVQGTTESSKVFSNQNGATEFTIENILCLSNFEFNQLVFTKLVGTKTVEAVENVDYNLTVSDETYVVEIGTSLTVTVVSGASVTLIALSNFDEENVYVENTYGGSIAIGNIDERTVFASNQKVFVDESNKLQINAKLNKTKNATFGGFYTSTSYNPETGELNTESPLSNELCYELTDVTSCMVVYAVFVFEYYDVSISTYFDEKNFEDKTINVLPDDTVGSVTISYNDIEQTGCDVSLRIPSGEICNVTIELISSESEDYIYEFVGYYNSLTDLINDKDNTPDTNYFSQNCSITATNDISLYGKIIKKYKLVVNIEDESIESISIDDESVTAGTITKYYYYNETIKNMISCKLVSYGYENYVVWQISDNDESLTTIKDNVDTTNTSVLTNVSNLVMKEHGITISMQGYKKYFNLNVISLVGDKGSTFKVSTQGGTANIISTSLNNTDIIFNEDNGVMQENNAVCASVIYKNSSTSVQAITKSNYVFDGWYLSTQYVNGELVGESLTSTNDVYEIPEITADVTLYCAFSPCYTFMLNAENGIDEVTINKENVKTNSSYFSKICGGEQVVVTLNVASGWEITSIDQLQTNDDITINTNETLSTLTFVMPNYDIELKVNAKESDEKYALTISSFYINGLDCFGCDEDGFDAGCGQVSIKNMDNVSTTLQVKLEENSTKTLVAKANVGYDFYGWYKFRAGQGLENTNLILSQNVNDQTDMQYWFNVYDANTNPNGAYISLGNNLEIVSDAIEKTDENLYIAVFVRNQTGTTVEGEISGNTLTISANRVTVQISGNLEALAYIKYSIGSTSNPLDFTSTAEANGGRIYFFVGLYHGYVVSKFVNNYFDFGGWDDKVNGEILECIYYVEDDGTTVYTVSIEISSQKYLTNVGQLLYDEQSKSYSTLTDNSVQVVKHNTQQVINKIGYLDVVDYVASVNPTQKVVKGTAINIFLYEFVGWFAKSNDGSYLQVSNEGVFTTTILDDTEYFAVFQYLEFTVTFVVNDDEGQLVNESDNVMPRSEKVIATKDIAKEYYAKANDGYVFSRWQVKFIYNDASKTEYDYREDVNIATFSGGVLSNIVCEAIFSKIDITIDIQAKLSNGDVSPSCNAVEYEGVTCDNIATTTRTLTRLKANSAVGYKFVSWQISEELSAYTLTYPSNNEIEIEFTSSTITNYTIVAVFDFEDIDISIDFDVKNTTTLQGPFAVITTFDFVQVDSPIQTKSFAETKYYINVAKGFLLTEDDVKFNLSDNDIIATLEDKTTSLSDLEKEKYSQRWLLTISNCKQDSTITILGESKKTRLNFAFLKDFDNREYENNSFAGYICFCTTEVVVDNSSLLTPVLPDLVFLGWSTNKFETGLILNETGRLMLDYWMYYDSELDLYPIYKRAQINLVLSISTNEGLMNSETFVQDAMSNIPSNAYTIVDDNITFDVGKSFELTVPNLKDKYYFYGYEYYIVKDNLIETKCIHTETLDDEYILILISQFEIKHYADYEYSTATNFDEYNSLIDGAFYIKYILEIGIELIAEDDLGNALADDVGGTITLLNATNLTRGLYNQNLQIQADFNDGYEIYGWYVNLTFYDVNDKTIVHTLRAPTTFKVVIVGKTVKVKFGECSEGRGTNITGNNIQYNQSDNSYTTRVGDHITLFAQNNAGYKFENSWLHSNGKTLSVSIYKITAEDSEDEVITLTPLFSVKNIEVWIIIPENTATLYRYEQEISYSTIGQQWWYVYEMNYFDEVNFSFVTQTKYSFISATLTAKDQETDITSKVENGEVRFNYQLYNDAQKLTINLNFEKLFWQSKIQESNLVINTVSGVALKKDFMGSGKSNDPYRIDSLNDLIKLAYVINNNVLQNDLTTKNAYNSPNTFYSINRSVNLEERFWTPIGTKENPFNSVISIYYMPSNIYVDRNNDPNLASSESLDNKVLEDYLGLFGYLGNDAKITLLTNNTTTTYVIIGVAVAVVVASVVTVLIVRKIRKNKIKNFDEHNKYLFDIE